MYYYIYKFTINLVGNVDYESGPYSVTIKRRKTAAKFCIRMINDNISELNEVFGLMIDTASLPSGLHRANPYTANVTIIDNEGKYYIAQNFGGKNNDGFSALHS